MSRELAQAALEAALVKKYNDGVSIHIAIDRGCPGRGRGQGRWSPPGLAEYLLDEIEAAEKKAAAEKAAAEAVEAPKAKPPRVRRGSRSASA